MHFVKCLSLVRISNYDTYNWNVQICYSLKVCFIYIYALFVIYTNNILYFNKYKLYLCMCVIIIHNLQCLML